jgi:hypothetical protein
MDPVAAGWTTGKAGGAMRNLLTGDAAGHPGHATGLGDSLAWLARSAVSIGLLAGIVWLMLVAVAGRT